IETVEAVSNVDAIIGTEGIDIVFFSPDDMKVQMGLPVSTAPLTHPRLREAMETTARAAQRAGKFASCIATTRADFNIVREMGYRLVVGGSDIVFVRIAADKLKELREPAGKAAPTPAVQTAPGIYGG